MFCPKCGAGAEREGVYCKRCGELLPGSRNRRIKNAFLIMPYLNLLCAILAAVSFVSLLVAFPEDSGGWAVGVAGVSCFLIAAYQIVSFMMSLRLRRRFVQGRGEPDADAGEVGEGTGQRALHPADTSSFVRAASVTENTTELLEAVRTKSKNARDDRG